MQSGRPLGVFGGEFFVVESTLRLRLETDCIRRLSCVGRARLRESEECEKIPGKELRDYNWLTASDAFTSNKRPVYG